MVLGLVSFQPLWLLHHAAYRPLSLESEVGHAANVDFEKGQTNGIISDIYTHPAAKYSYQHEFAPRLPSQSWKNVQKLPEECGEPRYVILRNEGAVLCFPRYPSFSHYRSKLSVNKSYQNPEFMLIEFLVQHFVLWWNLRRMVIGRSIFWHHWVACKLYASPRKL